MAMTCLLDSNTIIDYLSGKMPDPALTEMNNIVNEGLFISVISKIEVLGFNSGNKQIDDNTERFINLATTFELSQTIVDQTISIRKQYKIKLPDAIIASTALVYGLTLVTHNINDFNKISGLNVIDPHLL